MAMGMSTIQQKPMRKQPQYGKALIQIGSGISADCVKLYFEVESLFYDGNQHIN